jgi:hypothetical protein
MMNTFSDPEKAPLRKELEDLRERAAYWSSHNKGWDIFFRVASVILAFAVILCSGIATLYKNTPLSQQPSASSTMIAAAAAVMAGVDNGHFKFSRRQSSWRQLADAYSALLDQLNYTEPDKTQFLKRKAYLQHFDADGGAELQR